MKIEKKIIKKKLSFAEIDFEIQSVGEDILIIIRGGDKPHIGSCVLSVPRPSLSDGEKISCTSSVLNLLGHKDENICRLTAESFCKKFNKVAICVGGFHVDNLTEEKISEVVAACKFFCEVENF